MAQRVILGNRGGLYGLFVSKPGQDAMSAPLDNLLLSSARRNLQIIASGSGTLSGSPFAIAWPAQGFRPRVLINSQHDAHFTYSSDNSGSVTLVRDTNYYVDQYWNTSNKPYLGLSFDWFALGPGI